MTDDQRRDAGEPDDEAVPPDAPGLEVRLRRLEEILAELESDDLGLERALKIFEEGVTHVRACERTLAESELKVEELLDDGTTREFEDGDG